MMKLILASNSPRRKELLSKLNYVYDVVPCNAREQTNAVTPLDIVKELACHKAQFAYKDNRDAVVVGCDTVVDLDGVVLGKPRDYAEAVRMLTSLSNRQHKVHTGVCVMSKYAIYLFTETSVVTFRELTSKQITDYVDGGSPMDKAGAYGIQDSGFVSCIEGSYDNVMGFPSEKADAILKQLIK